MTLDGPVNKAPSLQQLFPGGDFAWAFRMRKAEPAGFFGPQDGSGAVLQQKNQILDQAPQRHLVFTDTATPLMERLHTSLQAWELELEGEPTLESVARQIEPDFILLNQADQKLVAAAVCFPSSWNPSDWGGKAIRDIHAVVPQLNAQIGEMINRFLTQLTPGKAFQRANWSLTRNHELNYHPDLQRPALDGDVTLDEIHLRLEHQLFTAIEGAVVMGIRIQPIPLQSLAHDRCLWSNLRQILETMPEEVARYKNLHHGLPRVIELMLNE